MDGLIFHCIAAQLRGELEEVWPVIFGMVAAKTQKRAPRPNAQRGMII